MVYFKLLVKPLLQSMDLQQKTGLIVNKLLSDKNSAYRLNSFE